MIEHLTKFKNWDGTGHEDVYDLIEINEVYTDVCTINQGFLAAHNDGLVINYALFRFAESDADGSNVKVELIYSGQGISGGLREMRHTYFANEGYIYYLPMDMLIESFQILKKYFD